jgi:hypothetical protein
MNLNLVGYRLEASGFRYYPNVSGARSRQPLA